jgi:hypothetical protein
MHGNATRENRETPSTPAGKDAAGRLEKALSPKSNLHVAGESDGRIVPAQCPNKGEQAPAEGREGRRPTKENIGQATPPRTQSRTSELSDPVRRAPGKSPSSCTVPRAECGTESIRIDAIDWYAQPSETTDNAKANMMMANKYDNRRRVIFQHQKSLYSPSQRARIESHASS